MNKTAMHTLSLSATFILSAAICLAASGTVHASVNQYWISASGSDSNDGSQTHPWKTLLHADSALVLGSSGTVVHVLPGTYNFGVFSTRRSGTASQRIRFISDSKWSAQIKGYWITMGNYIDVVGFDISCTTCNGGVQIGSFSTANSGLYTKLLQNRIHDIGTDPSICPETGAVQLAYNTHDVVIDSNLINRTGHYGGCSGGMSNHGIYLSGYHSLVTNNIVGNAAGVGIVQYHNPCENVVANNVVFHNYTGGIEVSGAHEGLHCSKDDYGTVENNIVVRNGWGLGKFTVGSFGAFGIQYYTGTGSHNVAYNNLMAENFYTNGSTTNNVIHVVSGWPAPSMSGNLSLVSHNGIFVNYKDDGSGDYHLALGSPAAYAGISGRCAPSPGVSPCVPSQDFVGSSRLVSSTYDNGVYVY